MRVLPLHASDKTLEHYAQYGGEGPHRAKRPAANGDRQRLLRMPVFGHETRTPPPRPRPPYCALPLSDSGTSPRPTGQRAKPLASKRKGFVCKARRRVCRKAENGRLPVAKRFVLLSAKRPFCCQQNARFAHEQTLFLPLAV